MYNNIDVNNSNTKIDEDDVDITVKVHILSILRFSYKFVSTSIISSNILKTLYLSVKLG